VEFVLSPQLSSKVEYVIAIINKYNMHLKDTNTKYTKQKKVRSNKISQSGTLILD